MFGMINPKTKILHLYDFVLGGLQPTTTRWILDHESKIVADRQ